MGDVLNIAGNREGRECLQPSSVVREAWEQETIEPKPVVSRVEVLRDLVTRALIWCFVISVGVTYLIIVFYGLGCLRYPDSFLHWLGAATVGQTAGLLGVVVKHLFPQVTDNKSKKQLDSGSLRV
jgi:hypothetical protein